MMSPSAVNVEISSSCNKSCSCCGRRKRERENPDADMNYGYMDMGMVHSVAGQLLHGTVVQLHNNGEPLMYPELGEAISCFNHCITGLNTNAKLINDKAHEIGSLNSITISIIPNDPEGNDQLMAVQAWLESKCRKPKLIVLRFLGSVIEIEQYSSWLMLAKEYGLILAYRQLHAPEGSFDYDNDPVIPEMGICQEALFKLSIDRHGNVSPCVRYDPCGDHRIGNLYMSNIAQIWIGKKRREFLEHHLAGRRDLASPICAKCDYWGICRG